MTRRCFVGFSSTDKCYYDLMTAWKKTKILTLILLIANYIKWSRYTKWDSK